MENIHPEIIAEATPKDAVMCIVGFVVFVTAFALIMKYYPFDRTRH